MILLDQNLKLVSIQYLHDVDFVNDNSELSFVAKYNY